MRFIFLFIPLLLFAQIDINTSKNIHQSAIVSIFPKPASSEVDANVSVELCFSEPLMPVRMPNVITLKWLEERKPGFFARYFQGKKPTIVKKRIFGSIEQKENCLLFKPDSNLSVGFYEVHTKPIFLRTFGSRIMVKPITYRFYVPEVINGFKLPPEPDEEKNNATLLGIDFNGNGIRDDVERLVIIEESKNKEFPKTQTAISLQYAYAWQKMIENPTIESRKYLEDASACLNYFINKHTQGLSFQEYREWEKKHIGKLGVKLEDAIFNTKERIIRRFEFNRACSGHVFDLPEASVDKCMINIDELGE